MKSRDLQANEKISDVFEGLKKICDSLFALYAFPISIAVTVMFWTLYAIDRDLVHPKNRDEYIPFYFNQLMHTNVSLMMIIEMVSVYHIFPNMKTMVFWLGGFIAVYLTWVEYIKYHTGFFVYAILDEFSLPVRMVLYAVTISVFFELYLMSRRVNEIIWRRRLLELKSSELSGSSNKYDV